MQADTFPQHLWPPYPGRVRRRLRCRQRSVRRQRLACGRGRRGRSYRGCRRLRRLELLGGLVLFHVVGGGGEAEAREVLKSSHVDRSRRRRIREVAIRLDAGSVCWSFVLAYRYGDI